MLNKTLISYIIPVYQAESFIYNNLTQFINYSIDSQLDSEIIIINDGSTDKTNEIIEKILKEYQNVPIKYLKSQKNQGKGLAIKSGVEASLGEYIVFTDCDLPYSFKSIRNVVDNLMKNAADVVIADRMHEESIYKIKSANLPYIYIRHTLGRVYNGLIKLFTHLKIEDTQAGLKGFNHKTAELIFKKMTLSGFSFDIDLLVCAQEHNKKILTVPIELNYESEITTINFSKQIFLMTNDLLRIFLKRITGYYRK